jgi:Transposase, Mutator family
MRTHRRLYAKAPIVYTCELERCPSCSGSLERAYVSGTKTVQTLTEVLTLAQCTKRCADGQCVGHQSTWKSAEWQQIAPCHSTYGYDVIAQIGWQRQTHHETFGMIHADLVARLRISESQVRYLYHHQYLPLLACHEREHFERLTRVAERSGLILSLDGLAPEGGEPQLWVIRELQTELTLRSGWLSQQDQTAFVNFLQPLRDLGLHVVALVSDKQRGLVPAVAEVFPKAHHGFCQLHYLKNAGAPVAEVDETMKITLRQGVREAVGGLIRQERTEKAGVLTVTGLVPSSVQVEHHSAPPSPQEHIAQSRETLVQDLLRRVRYLLTLKGRPPVRLAGLEMFERLTEVAACLDTLIRHHAEPRLVQLRQGLGGALQVVGQDYADLRQAATWLTHIADLLDPEGKPVRTGSEVRQELWTYLDSLPSECPDSSQLHTFYQTIAQTTRNYDAGLFDCYDVPDLPRTNNDRESEFRELNRRLLRTTGQKGLVRRLLQREGAWELIPRPGSFQETIKALARVKHAELQQERERVRIHRNRFRLHTRSVKQSRLQLKQLEQRWLALPATNSS